MNLHQKAEVLFLYDNNVNRVSLKCSRVASLWLSSCTVTAFSYEAPLSKVENKQSSPTPPSVRSSTNSQRNICGLEAEHHLPSLSLPSNNPYRFTLRSSQLHLCATVTECHFSQSTRWVREISFYLLKPSRGVEGLMMERISQAHLTPA